MTPDEPVVPGAPPSAEMLPQAVPPQVVPVPELIPNDQPIIGVSVISQQAETPSSFNIPGMLVRVTESDKQTANLERIILSVTGLLALLVGAISMIVIFALHYHTAGEIGAAAATIAGLISQLRRIQLRKKPNSSGGA